ncbi:hypothetical protein EJ110_NYTH13142 [Nymphaea thermarum]|nr:hypothetical protein EJ110_NYTH13142 [Nymphaea thermarum]
MLWDRGFVHLPSHLTDDGILGPHLKLPFSSQQGSAAMAPHSRFNSVVQAMRDIGIPSKTMKPVLRKLLELYDDNWALIEEEIY